MYHVGPYYSAKVLVETPLLIVAPLIFSLIIYFAMGLTITASQFFYFYLILILVVFSSASYGYLLSSVFPNIETAASLTPVVMMPIILFGGVFTNVDSYPKWITWL